jgi:hypothetical protein
MYNTYTGEKVLPPLPELLLLATLVCSAHPHQARDARNVD